jgi:hypothetical protein
MKKTFPANQVFSITTGRLFCKMGDIYDILEFMIGFSPFTHQIPIVCPPCQAALLKQHPSLANIQIPEDLGADNYLDFLEKLEAEYGDQFEVEAFPAGKDFGDIDRLIRGKTVISVITDGPPPLQRRV